MVDTRRSAAAKRPSDDDDKGSPPPPSDQAPGAEAQSSGARRPGKRAKVRISPCMRRARLDPLLLITPRSCSSQATAPEEDTTKTAAPATDASEAAAEAAITTGPPVAPPDTTGLQALTGAMDRLEAFLRSGEAASNSDGTSLTFWILVAPKTSLFGWGLLGSDEFSRLRRA